MLAPSRPSTDSPVQRWRIPPLWISTIPSAFWLLWGITLALDVCALVVGYVTAHTQHLQVSTAILPALHRYADLLGFYRRIGDYGTAAFFSQTITTDLFNYPALMAVPLHWLFAAHTPLQRYSTCFALWIALLLFISVRALSRNGLPTATALGITALVLATNFPIHLLYFTNNLELFVWAVVALGVCSYCMGYPWLAAACFGVGAALKYYPLALLGLFPFRRNWLKILLGLVTAFLANLLGLALMGPTITEAHNGLQASREVFAEQYLSQWRPIDSTYDHSLFGLLKSAIIHSTHHPAPWLLAWYIAVALPLLLLLYFLRIQFLPTPQRLLALSVIAVWVMPISQDYTLVLLLAPVLVLLLNTLRRGDGPAPDLSRPFRVALLCLGIVFGALTFLTVGLSGFGGYIRAVLLGVILACSLRRDFLATAGHNGEPVSA